MDNNLSISEIMQEDGHLYDLPSEQDVSDVFDALVKVTGHDEFILTPEYTLGFGDDLDTPVTEKMWRDVGEEANLVASYAYQIATEWCHIEAPSWHNLSE